MQVRGDKKTCWTSLDAWVEVHVSAGRCLQAARAAVERVFDPYRWSGRLKVYAEVILYSKRLFLKLLTSGGSEYKGRADF